MHKTLRFINAKLEENGKGSIDIYGDISDVKFWDEDVTPLEIKEKLDVLKDCKEIDIHINSYGGSVFAGLAIISMLDSIDATKTAYIEGIAASMASVIAVSADKVVMSDGSLIMIHKPSAFCSGNADDMRKTADLLDKTENSLIQIYMRKFNKSESELRTLLKDETYMSFDEANFYGLADELQGNIKIAAYADKVKVNNLIISKENKAFDKFRQKGDFAMEINAELKAKIQNLGIEISDNDDYSTLLDKLADKASEQNAEPTPEPAPAEPKSDEPETKPHTVSAEMDETVIAKAREYDKIKANSIENACKSGIQAMGEKFNRERWEKIFDSFTVEEINDQAKEWEEEGKNALNAGVHATSLEPVKAISKIDYDNII